MISKSNPKQITIDDFMIDLGQKLNPNNRARKIKILINIFMIITVAGNEFSLVGWVLTHVLEK